MSLNNNNLLYHKIKKEILNKIKTMPPNERIPSRNDLMKEYNVTRTTIDRAISELIGEGYLYSKDGSGTYVSENVSSIVQKSSVKTVNWGVILPNIMHDTYPGILRGVEDVANECGRSTIICNTDNNFEKQANYIIKLIESGVEGIVIVPVISDEVSDITPFKLLQEKNIPFVFCNRSVTGISSAPTVMSNSFYGGYIATKHLIKQGYRRIGYISRPLYQVSLDRYQGYKSAVAEAGIDLGDNYVIFEESFAIENPGYESTKLLLQNNPPVDAIFCFNDMLAKGAYQAITEAGLKVGHDIGIVGYDNTYICESLPVKLTSVQFKTHEIGTKAAELLLDIINGDVSKKNKVIVLQPELVVRESCGNQRNRN
ncbi:MAG TPA: GntR family transcriptional regulator [Clostridiaceae bacterium]|nr:GntR family transcriptional regulator [Clostridiaceae bacterium]